MVYHLQYVTYYIYIHSARSSYLVVLEFECPIFRENDDVLLVEFILD